jgi:hypothetical protein
MIDLLHGAVIRAGRRFGDDLNRHSRLPAADANVG